MDELTHASFFSGVGGLDLGLERAGWRTVSFSEIDPYACAVLAQRWPGVPNLGSITAPELHRPVTDGSVAVNRAPDDWTRAALWTGGFPCQDLSVAGKRRGMGEGTRSGLAYSFLALAERHRPRFVLLENVPGLLSSHGGRDMAALLGALVELGYGVGYRVLDARYFGVPQRRRRVFILGDATGGRAGAKRAAEVLSVGSRCRRHPPAGFGEEEGAAAVARPGIEIARAVTGTSGKRHDDDTDTLLPVAPHDARGQGRRGQGAAAVRGHEPDDGHQPDADAVRRTERPSSDPGGDGTSHGLARWLDDHGLAATINANKGGDWRYDADQAENLIPQFVTENQHGEVRLTDDSFALAGGGGKPGQGYAAALGSFDVSEDDLLPLGLDSHRYRCCGNGVVADVAEWIGCRLAEALT